MEVDGRGRDRTVRSLAREVLALPETVKILRALSSMRAARSHMAIVRDEYGGTAGIVTIEDLVEELVGEITDEYDEDPGRKQTEVDDVDGLTTIEEFGELTGYELPDGPYDTVAGYVMAQLGALPRLGDEVSVVLAPEGDAEGQPVRFTLTVTQMDGRRAAWFGLARAALPDAVPDA
jgi:putative hemolysin